MVLIGFEFNLKHMLGMPFQNNDIKTDIEKIKLDSNYNQKK